MSLDYSQTGKRIAKRGKELRLTQAKASERADIGEKYLSKIERAAAIPSTEVIMRLAIALETTPDEFLVGAVRHEDGGWKDVAELLRNMDEKELDLAKNFRPGCRSGSCKKAPPDKRIRRRCLAYDCSGGRVSSPSTHS